MIDWNNVVSAVATEEGLVVVEKKSDGTLGAPQTLGDSPKKLLPSSYYEQEMLSPQHAAYQGPGTYRQHAPVVATVPPVPLDTVQSIKVNLKKWIGDVPILSFVAYPLPAWADSVDWNKTDETVASGFVLWWNAHVAGKYNTGIGKLSYCPPTVVPCSVLNYALRNALSWWAANWK